MKLKSIGIGLLVVVILFIGIRVFNHFVSNKECVEVPLIVPDIIYQEIETKRDSLQLVIDSILNALNNTNQYEKEFNKAISDTDLLLSSNASYILCQNQSELRIKRLETKVDSLQQSHSFMGDSGAKRSLDKEVLRIANAKLILSEEYKNQYESYKKLYELKVQDSYLQDSVISKQREEIRRITLIGNEAITNLNKEYKKSKRYKKQRNGFIASTSVLAILVVVLLK